MVIAVTDGSGDVVRLFGRTMFRARKNMPPSTRRESGDAQSTDGGRRGLMLLASELRLQL